MSGPKSRSVQNGAGRPGGHGGISGWFKKVFSHSQAILFDMRRARKDLFTRPRFKRSSGWKWPKILTIPQSLVTREKNVNEQEQTS